MRQNTIEWAEIPRSPWRGVRFVDSHLHLGEPQASALLALAAANDTLLVTCGTNRRTSEEGLRLAGTHPERVKAFVGVHPSEAEKQGDLLWLERALPGATGSGEIGLDPTYPSGGSRGAQARVFLTQLEQARKLRKPVQVHSRGAEESVLETLGGFRLRGVLMHWLESEGALPSAVERGFFVSFGPALLYTKRLQRMAARCPSDQVVVETDSPVAFRPLGGASGPSLIPSVAFKLAALWGVGFVDARAAVARNALRFLGMSEKG